MNTICGAKASSRGIQLASIRLADLGATGVGPHRQVDHVGALGHTAAAGIQRVLEEARHQDALVAGDDVFGAVAVVHVEVDDRHALQAQHVERMARGDRHVVVEAKAHHSVARRVVAGRSHRAEGGARLASHHRIGGRHGRTGGALHRAHGCARRRCVSGSNAW